MIKWKQVLKSVRDFTFTSDRSEVMTGVERDSQSEWGIAAWAPVNHSGRGPCIVIRLGKLTAYRFYGGDNLHRSSRDRPAEHDPNLMRKVDLWGVARRKKKKKRERYEW